MLAQLRASIVMMALFTLVFGLGYPLAMTAVAGAAFPAQAGGSLVQDKAGHVIGSSLIAQGFAKPEYLHPRPSAAGMGYDPLSSSGSNLGPLDPALAKRIAGDAAAIRKDIPNAAIPADALTTSGSGLPGPDVSPEKTLACRRCGSPPAGMRLCRPCEERCIDTEDRRTLPRLHRPAARHRARRQSRPRRAASSGAT